MIVFDCAVFLLVDNSNAPLFFVHMVELVSD